MQMQGAVFFSLEQKSLMLVNSVSSTQTNTIRWQATTKTMAPETKQKLCAYSTLTMPELSQSLPHTHYHLKFLLSSKPSRSLRSGIARRTEEAYLPTLKNDKKENQKTSSFLFSAQCGNTMVLCCELVISSAEVIA